VKKRVFGIVLLSVMIFSLLSDPAAALGEGRKSKETVTFGVASDIHIKKTASVEGERFREALEFFSDAGAKSVFITGDLTDYGEESGYKQYTAACEAADINEDIEIHEVLGNHDRYSKSSTDNFKNCTGDEVRYNLTVNGYHFILMSPDDKADAGSYKSSLDWLKEQLAIAAADTGSLPIFVFAHHAIRYTVRDSGDWYAADLTEDLFDDYPQVVFFSGHSHVSNRNPLCIWQDDFTAINVPTLSYYLPDFYDNYKCTDAEVDRRSQIAQALLVTVENSSVTVKTYDLLSDSFISDQIWTFDTAKQKTGDLSSFPYNIKDRTEASKAPYYGLTDKITVDYKSESLTEITFDQAKIRITDRGDIDLYYIVTVTDSAGQTVSDEKIWSDYFITPRADSLTTKVTGLKEGETYKVSVTPVNAYGKSGDPLTKSFRAGSDQSSGVGKFFADIGKKLTALFASAREKIVSRIRSIFN